MLRHKLYIAVIMDLVALLLTVSGKLFLLREEMSVNAMLCTNAYSALSQARSAAMSLRFRWEMTASSSSSRSTM